MEFITTFLALILTLTSLNIFIQNVEGQSNVGSNNCSLLFRGVRRAGANMAGTLNIPVDETFPKFQLRLKFSRAIHHVTVRQLKLRAKDVGSRREFLVDPVELEQDGIMKINTFLRLNHMFGQSPRLIGVSYNGKLLCGENVFDDGVLIDLKTTTVRSVPKLVVTTRLPKDQEEEDEVFN